MNNYWHYTHSQRFTSKLKYRNVELRSAADVVQFSFIAQTSICGLDLEVCQSYQVNNFPFIGKNYPSLSYSKCFISSEEKCRKVLATSRNLLYTLHLDLPKGRDWSLKNSSQPKHLSYYCIIPHIAKIQIGDEFYINILYKIIDNACENTHNNVKVLKWFIKFNGLKDFHFHELPDNILNHFIDCMHPGISDTDFVIECFKNWLDSSEKTGSVANLLYQIHRLGRKLDDILFWNYVFPHSCLLHNSFLYASDVFKFMNAPAFPESFIVSKIYSISYTKPSWRLMQHLIRENENRSSLLLHLYWSYLNRSRNLPAVSESLRIIWNSVPEEFLCYEEIASAFKEEGFGPKEIQDIFRFFSEAVDEFPSKVEPRSLKHYCRIRIRRRLWKCGLWLPDGIRQSGLPPKLQAYLNL